MTRQPFVSASLNAMLLLLLTACTVVVDGGTPERAAERDERLATIDRWAEEAVEAGRAAGISLAVERGGERLLARGYGHADLENDVVAGEQTVHRIGSITKQFTAAMVMQLVEAGEVELDAEIGRYADFPTGDHTVTVRHLLNHTSGIPSYTSLGEVFWSQSRLDLTHDELLGLVRELPFDFEPGREWRYNNSGYYLLGVLIERVTGKGYAEVVQEHIFDPVGLEDTTYCGERELIANRAEGYELVDGELLNDQPLSMDTPFAAGALCSTVLDLLAWQRALASGEVVSPESYELMTTSGATAEGPYGYGFGLSVSELEGHRKISHGGGINGFVSMLARYPDEDLGIAVLVNTPGPTASQLEERIARLMLGLEIEEVADEALEQHEAAFYVGTYDLGELQLRIFWSEDRLRGHTEGQPETVLRYQGEDTFVPDFDDTVRIVFHREGERVTGLTLFQGGSQMPGVRVE